VALPLIPRFWGHSFFNPKDTPFAAFFTLSTLLGAYLVNHYLKVNQESQLKFNRTLLYSILYGILVGWLTAIRIGGFFVLFFVALAYLVGMLGVKTSYRNLRIY
jgi:4-amino-4-deoxy-L-arabinose transferase-like glycosyltransferase